METPYQLSPSLKRSNEAIVDADLESLNSVWSGLDEEDSVVTLAQGGAIDASVMEPARLNNDTNTSPPKKVKIYHSSMEGDEKYSDTEQNPMDPNSLLLHSKSEAVESRSQDTDSATHHHRGPHYKESEVTMFDISTLFGNQVKDQTPSTPKQPSLHPSPIVRKVTDDDTQVLLKDFENEDSGTIRRFFPHSNPGGATERTVNKFDNTLRSSRDELVSSPAPLPFNSHGATELDPDDYDFIQELFKEDFSAPKEPPPAAHENKTAIESLALPSLSGGTEGFTDSNHYKQAADAESVQGDNGLHAYHPPEAPEDLQFGRCDMEVASWAPSDSDAETLDAEETFESHNNEQGTENESVQRDPMWPPPAEQGDEEEAANNDNQVDPNPNDGENEGVDSLPWPRFSSSEDERIFINEEDITDYDIRCGQSQAGKKHPGNMDLLGVIQENLQTYISFGKKHGGKTRLTRNVLQHWTQGRFIDEEDLFLKTEKEARGIVSQKFRDAKRTLERQQKRKR